MPMDLSESRVSKLFGISYPIIQGGMVWCSGWKLASAVSNAGGLGIIGSGSMSPGLLKEHIRKTREATKKAFAVNVPLLTSHTEEILKIIVAEKVSIVFTAAGNPKIWTPFLKENGITVAHVVGGSKYAVKCEEAGVDAVVAEGFEAGGHNSREETTTFTLIPEARKAISLPLIAAGGIASGRAMLAAMALGAEGVQMGSVFAASEESSAHISFKKKIIKAAEGDTRLTMKKLIPVRMLKNELYRRIEEASVSGKSRAEIMDIMGRDKARLGMFEGDIDEGALEIGQVSSMIKEIRPAEEIIKSLIKEYIQVRKALL